MKKIILLFSLFIISNFSYSQSFWERGVLGISDNHLLNTLSYVNANVVWGSLRNNGALPDGQPQVQRWARSIDGGTTWTVGNINLGNTNLGIGNISAVSDQVAYIAAFISAAGAGGGIWKTADGGVTWSKQTTASFNSTNSFPNSVHFWNENEGIALGDPTGTGASRYYEVYTTTNGGVNWVRRPAAGLSCADGEFGIVDRYQVINNTIWFSTTDGKLYKSSDKGLTWTSYQTLLDTFSSTTKAGEFAFADENNGIITSTDFEFFNTTDGGATWTVYFPIENIRNGKVCRVPGYPTAYVLGGDDPENEPNSIAARGTSYSLDLGQTWNNVNTIPGELFAALDSALEFYDIHTGICGDVRQNATTGGVFKYVGTIFDDLATSSLSKSSLLTASPNPTSGLVTIAGKGISNIVITDVLGKQVANTNFTSVESATIDMSSYNAGVYLVKVTNANGNASTIKVVRQ